MSVYKRADYHGFYAQASVGKLKRNQKFPFPGGASATQRDKDATEKAARTWFKNTVRELEREALKGTSQSTLDATVDQVWSAYLESPETRQLKTYKDTKQRLGVCLKEVKGEKAIEFWRTGGPRKLRDKIHGTRLANRPRTNATTNRYNAAMRAGWEWGIEARMIPADMTWPKLMLSEPRGRDRYLSDSERTALLAAAKKDATMHAAIVVAISTGMRQGNLLSMTWRQIDFDKKKIMLPVTKNGRAHTVHLPSSAVAALEALKAGKIVHLNSPVFLDGKAQMENWRLMRDFKKLCKDVGIPTEGKDKFTWHCLRHSTASYLAQSGASLLEIGSVLGHISTQSTARYSHMVAGAKVTGHDKLDAMLSGT